MRLMYSKNKWKHTGKSPGWYSCSNVGQCALDILILVLFFRLFFSIKKF